MKTPFILGMCLSTLFVPLYSSEEVADVGVEVDVGEPYDEDDEYIWIGPGWYYGVWFDNEVEFDDWHHDHHDHHGDHHHGGGHHG
ncbi:MAG: hypothetical protein ACRENF_05265, partial [Thermodesulfobacteriota bacterium]